MHNLLILGCSATKRKDPGLIRALDRYNGPMYRVIRKAIAQRPGLYAALDIRILSAEYGLIGAEAMIADYDRKMNLRRAEELFPDLLPMSRQLSAQQWSIDL